MNNKNKHNEENKLLIKTLIFLLIILCILIITFSIDALLKFNPDSFNQNIAEVKPDLCKLSNCEWMMVYVKGYFTGQIYGKKSNDNGITWKEPFKIGRLYGDTPHIISTKNDTIIVTSSYAEGSDENICRYIKSFDNGKTWSKVKYVNYSNIGFCSGLNKVEDIVYLCGGNWSLNQSKTKVYPQASLGKYDEINDSFNLLYRFNDSKLVDEWDFLCIDNNHWVAYFRGLEEKTFRVETYNKGINWASPVDITQSIGFLKYPIAEKLEENLFILSGEESTDNKSNIVFWLSNDGINWINKTIIQNGFRNVTETGSPTFIYDNKTIFISYHHGKWGDASSEVNIYHKRIQL